MTTADLDRVCALIRQATMEAYAARAKFPTEYDFKYELFHRLASKVVDGTALAKQTPGTSTCRLHAEARPMNGNSSKADLLICSPSEHADMMFNYRPEVVVELKKRLTAAGLEKEVTKFSEYRPKPRRLFIISANPTADWRRLQKTASEQPVNCVEVIGRDRTVLLPPPPELAATDTVDVEGAIRIIEEGIAQTLRLYGAGRNQFRGFFWCNCENHQAKRWTFPSQGDFNAQLYHCLRSRLPIGVDIVAKVHPPGMPQQLDLAVICRALDLQAAIEVKMNWDQFRPKYNHGSLCRSEAATILAKFREYRGTSFLVAIQGTHVVKPRNKTDAMSQLRRSLVPVRLFSFDEREQRVVREELGPAPGQPAERR